MANATQPASNKQEAYGSVNWYGAAPNNSNRQAVNQENYIQTQDATPATNIVSPVALSATAVTTIQIPQNAVSITLIGAVAFSFSEVAGTTALSQSVLVPANTPVTLSVARQLYLYLLGGSAGNVSFFFQSL